MQEKTNIQTSTLRVPKSILEEIKIYCRKAGKPVGEWVETAWKFIEKNDFDIYDKETTPFLPVPPDIEKERNQVEALCMLMSEFITAQKQIQLPAPELIAKAAEEKVRAEMKAEEQAKDLQILQEENNRLRNEIKVLQEYKEKAHRELCRVRDEQRTIGKIKVNTELSNPQPIGFSGILLAKRQNSFYCTYFLHNRNVADTKSPYPIKRLEVIRWFNQKRMVFNQSLS